MKNPRTLKADFKDQLAEIISTFLEAEKPGIPPFEGGVAAPPLEHTTRVNFLDDLMIALGWNLKGNEHIVQEARIKDGTTTFIDYLGIDSNRKPLIIVEAKSWEKPLIRPGKSNDHTDQKEIELLQLAINYIHNSSVGIQVTQEWQEWIKQVHGYVKTLNDGGHAVKRLVITSGQWLIVFTDPVETFCNNEALSDQNVLILGLDNFVLESDSIFELLAKDILARQHPYCYRPTQLFSMISKDTIVGAFRSVIINKHGGGASPFQPVPIIHVSPSMLLLRDDGELLHVINEHEEVNILPHHYHQVPDHLIRLRECSTVLENLINDQLATHITILPINRFPGFKKKTKTSLIGSADVTDQLEYVLPKADIAYEFLIATGENSHFLLEASRAENCQFHEWANCRGENYAVGTGPILIRSLKGPASFFISSEGHHCAQSVIHDRRSQKCHIAGFEEFVCCKTCAFESVCWNQDEQASLPCGS